MKKVISRESSGIRLEDIQIRDPYFLLEGGAYYLYGSTDKDIWRGGTGFDAYRGGGTEELDGPFPVFRPDAGFWSEKNFWAPEVYPLNGAYYMFATFKPKAGRRGTAVLRAENPLGPFVPITDEPVTPPERECLDGSLWIENETCYMAFCHEWQQIGDGTVCAMRLSPDLTKAAGEPVTLFAASSAPWAYPLAGRAPGSYVTDGPNLLRGPDGALYMLWSSFGADGRYCLGYARSDSGGLFEPWEQQPEPLVSGGGHGMFFRDESERLYIAFHSPNDTPNERCQVRGAAIKGGKLFLL
ncbi:MAG: glycoside hydrolase family 43 protein [Clostridiales bacterium]|jgi:GH43 family beta-xylosidase|nr:glycoside hydrolase family 43 protein [Clostridiales bacterium]